MISFFTFTYFLIKIPGVPKCRFPPRTLIVAQNQTARLLCDFNHGGVETALRFRWIRLPGHHQDSNFQLNLLKKFPTLSTKIPHHFPDSFRTTPDTSQTQILYEQLVSSSTNSTLLVHVSDRSDYAPISCEVSNEIGLSTQPCLFHIKPPPGRIFKLLYSNI